MPPSDDSTFPAPPRDPAPKETGAEQAAADWVVRRDRGLTPEQKQRLSAWERTDPRHATELQRMETAWTSLDKIRAVPELEAMADVIVAQSRRRRQRRQAVQLFAVTLAAAAAAVLGFFAREPAAPTLLDAVDKNYRVLASTVHRQTLPDGSIAELNGASRVDVDFTATERRVRLVEGEVHFIVAKNPERPFFVSAGPVTVRAVGTAFNVRLATEMVEVLVTEGKVRLEASDSMTAGNTLAVQPSSTIASAPVTPTEVDPNAALVAGQRAVINRAAGPVTPAVQIGAVAQAEISEALGWQSTRLVFNNTPLAEVVEGFNRYNSHRLTIGSPAVRNRTLTGVFRADNIEGFVRLLRHSIDVKAELRTSTETVLLPIR